ncbi:Neurotransmitter-gated ion-channel ligand binding domain [Mactra antiquata]
MTTTVVLMATWTDEQLVWNPNSVGYTTVLYWPQSEIWTPEIAVKNAFGNSKNLGYDTLNTKIYYLGIVSWYPNQVFVTTCTIDVEYFPFDSQVCEIQLTAWSYSTTEMTFSNSSSLDMSKYSENPSWSVESTSVNFNADGYEPQMNIVFTLKRKASYTVVSVVLPICLLAILNLFVFSLPASSGEKVGYAVTVFLSLAVFLTIIESSMPKNSQKIPLFSMYMMLLVVQSTFITILAIWLVKVLTNDELGKPVPWLLVKFTEIMEMKCCKKKKQRNKVMDASDVTKEKIKTFDDNLEVEKEDEDVEEIVDWAKVVRLLDRFFLLLFTFIFIILTAVFGLIVAL